MSTEEINVDCRKKRSVTLWIVGYRKYWVFYRFLIVKVLKKCWHCRTHCFGGFKKIFVIWVICVNLTDPHYFKLENNAILKLKMPTGTLSLRMNNQKYILSRSSWNNRWNYIHYLDELYIIILENKPKILINLLQNNWAPWKIRKHMIDSLSNEMVHVSNLQFLRT